MFSELPWALEQEGEEGGHARAETALSGVSVCSSLKQANSVAPVGKVFGVEECWMAVK